MKVTVFFQGICTHVMSNLPAEVRVVLVDGRFGLALPDGGQIPPHEAKLEIARRFIADAPAPIPGLTDLVTDGPLAVWTMQGVELEIVADDPGALTLEPHYRLLPSLSKIAQTNHVTIPLELSARVVRDGAAPCVFTIRNGKLDALQHKEAVHGKLTVEGDAPMQLSITRCWDRMQSFITLQPSAEGEDPVIHVANTGVDDDKNIDFALHYGVTTFMPSQPLTLPLIPVRSATPEELRMLALSTPPDGALTITYGCSNSTYP